MIGVYYKNRDGRQRCDQCPPWPALRTGDLAFNREPTKPAIGKVHSHITAQRPLRSDRKRVADDERPDHQHWIDREKHQSGPIIASIGKAFRCAHEQPQPSAKEETGTERVILAARSKRRQARGR